MPRLKTTAVTVLSLTAALLSVAKLRSAYALAALPSGAQRLPLERAG